MWVLMIGLMAAGSANAIPINWSIPNTALTPYAGSFTSGSISGTFSWDADTQTASNVNITVVINGNTSVITSAVSNYGGYFAVLTNSLANDSPTGWVDITSLTNAGGTVSDVYVIAGLCAVVEGITCDSDNYGTGLTTLTGSVPPTPRPPTNPIPTLSEWAQILMMLMMIGTVGWYSRKMTR